MEMKDGNFVQINISQISDKMPYYLQMQEIIEVKKDGKDGVIYLDIGDYYEPIK
jgi:cell division septal protein FtsQ